MSFRGITCKQLQLIWERLPGKSFINECDVMAKMLECFHFPWERFKSKTENSKDNFVEVIHLTQTLFTSNKTSLHQINLLMAFNNDRI